MTRYHTLFALADSVGGRIAYNPDRELIQVLGCSGTEVIGSFKLPEALHEQAKLEFPDVLSAIALNEIANQSTRSGSPTRFPIALAASVLAIPCVPIAKAISKKR